MKKTLSRLPRVVRLAALSAVLLALCSKSSPLYAFNDWMDANIFFTMGRSMLGGRVLYRDVFDHKGPVLYLLYGLAGLVGGTDFRGVLVLEIIAMTSFLYTGLRTAELLDVMMIVFVRGKLPNEEVLNMAEDAGIAVVMTEYTLYDACGRLYAAGLPGGTGRRKP